MRKQANHKRKVIFLSTRICKHLKMTKKWHRTLWFDVWGHRTLCFGGQRHRTFWFGGQRHRTLCFGGQGLRRLFLGPIVMAGHPMQRTLISVPRATVHFISSHWELISATLGCMPLDESHTAAIVADFFDGLLKDWAIKKKSVSSATVDNASNFVAAVR